MGLSPDAWAQIGTTLFNTGSQLYTNSQNRKNALADWNRQNAYNAPQQQMRRFQEAGLNPNLIYKQTNEAAPVRSTDYVAPQLNEGLLDVLGKSNAIEVQNLNKESLRLRNDNQELQNDILRAQSNDLKDKVGIQNRQGNANIDLLQEGANLKRQERSQKDLTNPLDVKEQEAKIKIMNKQFDLLSQNYQFNQLSNPQKLRIGKEIETNLRYTGTNILRQGYNLMNQSTSQYADYLNSMRKSFKDMNLDDKTSEQLINLLKLAF